MELAESLSAVALQEKEPARERRDFMLTQAQRLYIQHHLPRFFTLVPMRCTAVKGQCASKGNLDDSQPCLVVERKRGRPEGSTKKAGLKFWHERKSRRMDSMASVRVSLRKKKSMNSFSESERSNDSQKESEFGKEGPMESISVFKSLDQPSEVMPELFPEVSLEEQMSKTCKESEGEVEEGVKERPTEVKKDNESPPLQVKKSEEEAANDDETVKKPQKPRKKMSKKQSLQGANSKKDEAFSRENFQAERLILRRLKAHRQIFPFLEPVNEQRDGAPDYYKQITSPIDVQTIEFKLKTGIYKLREQFHSDIRLMWSNSKTYNRKNALMQRKTEDLESFYLSMLSRPKSARHKEVQ